MEQEERKRRGKKRREGVREWMKRGLAGRLWGTDRHWNVLSLWWEEERLNTLDNQHSSNHSTRTPNISLLLLTRTCTAKRRRSPLHVLSLCLTICYSQSQVLIFIFPLFSFWVLSFYFSFFISLSLSLPLPFTVSCKGKLPKKKKKKKNKKLLESDNCGSLRYIPIRKGDTCRCRGSRAEL